MPKYRCRRCGAQFRTKQQLGGHLSKGLACHISEKKGGIGTHNLLSPSVTHNLLLQQPAVPVITEEVDISVPESVLPAISSPVLTEVSSVITAPEEALNQLLQRPCHADAAHRVVPVDVSHLCVQASFDTARTFKLHQTQEAYDEYCSLVRSKHSDQFWMFFSSVYKERSGVIDRVLSACRTVYVKKDLKATFPCSVRALRHSAKEVGNFNSHILHEIVVNLRQFNLGNVQVRYHSNRHMHIMCAPIYVYSYIINIYVYTYVRTHISSSYMCTHMCAPIMHNRRLSSDSSTRCGLGLLRPTTCKMRDIRSNSILCQCFINERENNSTVQALLLAMLSNSRLHVPQKMLNPRSSV